MYFGSHRIAEAVVSWLATVRGEGWVDLAGCCEVFAVALAPACGALEAVTGSFLVESPGTAGLSLSPRKANDRKHENEGICTLRQMQ